MRKTLTLLALLNAPLFLIAEPGLNLEARTGITFAQFDEELYYSNDSSLCSLLEWKEQLLYTLALKTSLETDSFYAAGDFSFSSNIISSQMRDSDFLKDGTKFSYTIHDAECYALNASLSAGIKLTRSSFTVIPAVKAEYSYDSFTGGQGRGWKGDPNDLWPNDGLYHPWDSPEAHYLPDGKNHINGVDYALHSVNIFAGLAIRKSFLSGVTVSAQVYVSPFSYHFAEDTHKNSHGGSIYHDVFYGAFDSLEYEASILCPLTQKLVITAGIKGFHILHKKGKAFMWFDEESRDIPLGQKAGIKAIKHTVYTGIKYSL
ncbi:MAG: hypothetical protein J5780_04300 [Treponema sp.]|nr:hypothetical protein [Treponema sp.]